MSEIVSDTIEPQFTATLSTDEIFRGGDTSRCLSDDLNTIEANITTLQEGKASIDHTHATYLSEDDAVATFAPISHTHATYLSEDDAVATFALANHTHSEYLSASHTHSDLESAITALQTGKADTNHTHSDLETAIEAVDASLATKAASTHTHAQSEITGLVDKLTEIDTAIAALQSGTGEEEGSTVEPMLVASMHLGKLDNNSGAEVTSSTRICSDPFAVQNGKSYWQVNDKAVNMYALLYDSEEVFLEYLGNFASGAEIAVNNESAAYMRLGSLLGEYDLTNEFRIYDVDPNSTGDSSEETTIDAYTKAESDARYALIAHTHSDYLTETDAVDAFASISHTHADYLTESDAVDAFSPIAHTHTELHTHSNQTVLDGITAEKVAAWDAGTGSSSTTTIDAYTKTESDARFAPVTHVHAGYMTESDAVDAFAAIDHTHSSYAASSHTHSDYAALTHTHTASEVGAAASSHTHTPASIGAATSSHTHTGYAASDHTHSGYAASSHTHSNYLSTSGGTVSGDVNVTGVFRVGGQQSVYNSGTMITLATNNLQTMIAGSSIYSKVTISVSSDERLKENVEAVDVDKCIDFIKGIDVKTFNYIGNEAPCMGVIAQDVQKNELAKFFVSVQPGEEGYLSVKAADLVFPLIAAVQRLSAEVDELKTRV